MMLLFERPFTEEEAEKFLKLLEFQVVPKEKEEPKEQESPRYIDAAFGF